MKESEQLGCVSQDTEPPTKSFLRKSCKLGSYCTVTSSKGKWHPIKIWERKSQELFKSVNLKNAIPVRQDLTLQENLDQERCARREAWDLAKNVHELKAKDKATFYSPTEA